MLQSEKSRLLEVVEQVLHGGACSPWSPLVSKQSEDVWTSMSFWSSGVELGLILRYLGFQLLKSS